MTFTNDFVIYDQKVQWDFWSALLPFKGKCHFNTEKIQFKVQTTCVVYVGGCASAPVPQTLMERTPSFAATIFTIKSWSNSHQM